MWVPHQPSLLRAYPHGDLCRGQHARLPATGPPWGAHSTPGSPTCPLLPFRVRFGASSSTQEMLHPLGTAYSRGYPDPGSGSLRLQLDCGEPRPGSLSGPYRTKAAKRMMVRSWRKKHSPARRSLEEAAAPSAIPGGGGNKPRIGRAAPCKPLLWGRRLLPTPRKDRGKQGRGEGPEAAVGKGKRVGGVPSRGGSPPCRASWKARGLFALLSSARLSVGCCRRDVFVVRPERKPQKGRGRERSRRSAPRLWETAAVAPGPARLGLWGPGAGLGTPHGERFRAGVVVMVGPLGAAAGTLRALTQPLRGAAAPGSSSRPQTSARRF